MRIIFVVPRQRRMTLQLMRQGIRREIVENAIQRWHNNFNARNPEEETCFKLFEETQNKIVNNLNQ